ncbi:MAG: RluA family pseudouridine synthase [Treponema sp.]|nr:RluA family pseudouridine synthase [Treponema sp.]
MEFTHVTAGDDDDGRRLDKIIRRYLNDESLSQLYSALRKGLIKVDGKKRAQDFRVSAGSDIAIADFLTRTPALTVSAPKDFASKKLNPSDILFRNDDILILNKPYDIPVQKSRANDTSLADMVAAEYASQHKKMRSLSFRPGPLHRLDRKTTGIIVFSQSLRGAQWFSQAIKEHRVQKIYLALIQGKLETEQKWEDNIAKKDTSSQNFKTVSVTADADNGKTAHSIATPLAYGSYHGKPVTLAQVEIGTGRKHQIRAQAASHGFPLLGDTVYGGIKINEEQDFFLHAYRLVLNENPLSLPHEILADISTKFAKMLNNCLIKFSPRL